MLKDSFRLLCLSICLIHCQVGTPLPDKISPFPSDPSGITIDNEPFICHEHNDCPFGEICNTHGSCQEPTFDEPATEYLPGDPSSGDPLTSEPTSPTEQDIDPCLVGECTYFSEYFLCLEDGDIPLDSVYCDLYTYEGCPEGQTPFEVVWEDGWIDCICLQEC